MRTAVACISLIAATGCTSIDVAQPAFAHQTVAEVDSRIELMSVIQLLSGYNLTAYFDSDYKTEAKNFFAPCADHPAVTNFAALSSNDFNFSVVPEAFIALSEPPDLEQRFAAKSGVILSAGGLENYDRFLALTRRFAAECRFRDFYLEHRPYYDQLIARSRPSINASTRSLVSYLGTPLGPTNVVIGPLLHDGGFATRYAGDDGETIAYAFVGPVATIDGQASFGEAERLEPLIAHEFAHTVINPLTAKYVEQVAASERNFAPLAAAMKNEGYSSWEQVVNESIIRALTARLTAHDRGKAAGKSEVADELKRGFVYVPALSASLQRYETERRKYPTFADFYPQLLDVFRQPAKPVP